MILGLILAGGGCTYLHQAAQQGRYAREQAPQQRVMKHRLAREKYFVYGVIHEGAALPRNSWPWSRSRILLPGSDDPQVRRSVAQGDAFGTPNCVSQRRSST